MQENLTGKTVWYQHPYDARDYGEGEVLMPYINEGVSTLVIKMSDTGDLKHIPTKWIKRITK